MNEEYSYIFYTFFKNLQEMKEKPDASLKFITCMSHRYFVATVTQCVPVQAI